MRSIIITQTSDTQYCLQASETLQVIHLADGKRPREVSSKTDTLNYLKVCATVGGDTETAEVKTPSGEIATSTSLALREEQGSLIATMSSRKCYLMGLWIRKVEKSKSNDSEQCVAPYVAQSAPSGER